MSDSSFKYMISGLLPDGRTYLDIQELSEQHYELLSQAYTKLFGFASDEALFMIAEMNYKELLDGFSINGQTAIEAFKNRITVPISQNQDVKKISFDMNRLFLNFLSSIRTYIDHWEATLKRKYEADDTHYLNFKKNINKIYDENAEYRFMYELRNYAQHCGLPIVIGGGIDLDSDSDEIVFNLHANRSRLLSDFKWKRIIKDWISEQKDLIMMIPIIQKYFELITEINSVSNDDLLKTLEAEALEILGAYYLVETVATDEGVEVIPCIWKLNIQSGLRTRSDLTGDVIDVAHRVGELL